MATNRGTGCNKDIDATEIREGTYRYLLTVGPMATMNANIHRGINRARG